MNKRRLYLVAVLCIFSVFVLSSEGLAARKKTKRHVLTAKSSVLVNADNSKELFGKSVHRPVLPASTVKVMTALIVLERLPLDKVITIGTQANRVQPSKLDLKPGEHYTVSDLLYGVLMMSANDASVVLAEAVAGTERDFVQMMNQRARALGARHTRFANSHGLPSTKSQYTTAYDISLIFREAMKFPLFKEVMAAQYKTIASQEGRSIDLKNHNKMLWKKWKNHVYGKTGYTRKAKQCFVGYVEYNKKTFVVAVFGCRQRWNDIRYIIQKYAKIPL